MPNNNNRINFQVGYNVDQASVNAVKKSLQDLQNIKFKDFKGPRQDLELIKRVAGQVLSALTKAFNVNLNSLNTQQFNASLKQALLSIDKIYSSFSKAGAQGQVAFSRMASEVLTTNMQLKLTNSLVSQMGETMANTVKWGIASSVMNNFTNSVRQAFDYVKALDSSLNDIRIVTKQSSEEMANFAVQANNSAQALGRSTMDYTKAALTFYQQGLDEASVQARTESVLKAQNITGAGEEMADYLTAVWNGYKVANEEAELYVDKLAAVADSSASNMSLLAIAMSKVASSANLLGVPVDNLNAQIATIVATTRQAPESVGNALKTIYSRINDIATGADDALISLGNYSAKMALVGINVLDANGRLRDTGDVIDEIGGKWETLSHEQQIYLARTMAGQRQYNNLLALFENWGKYSDLVNVSMEAQGATALKNAIYLESLGAKMEQLGAAGERVKAALIDEEDLKGLVDFGTGIVNTFGTLIESIGGGKTAILALGSIFTQVFSGTITKLLNNIVTHFQDVKNNALILKQDIASIELLGKSQGYDDKVINEMVDAKKEIASYYSLISALQLKSYNTIVQLIGANKDLVLLLEEKVLLGRKYKDAIEQASQKSGLDFLSQFSMASLAVELLVVSLEQFKTASSLMLGNYDGFQKLYDDVIKLLESIGSLTIPKLKLFKELYEEIGNIELTGTKLNQQYIIQKLGLFLKLSREIKKLTSIGVVNAGLFDSLSSSLDIANAKLELSKRRAEEFRAAIQQFSNIKGIVDMSSGIGRLASGLSSIKNLGNIWSNENLSGGLKLLQTVTNLGMTIPMLVSAYKTLQTTTKALSATFLTQQKVLLAQLILGKKEVAVTQLQNTVLEISQIKHQKGVYLLKARKIAKLANIALTGQLASVQLVLNVATDAHTVALKELKAAQDAVNAAMSANPIGAIITGITLAITAITALVKIYDHFTMSVKEAELAIDAFNEKQKLMANSNATLHLQTSSLESIKNLYELLAKKAGAVNFDATIDNLTLKLRERYNLLKNLIVSYNLDVLAGYNALGLVILQNNTNLKEQIEILKARRQAEIDSYVSSEEFQSADKGYQVKANQAKSDLESFQQYRNETNWDSLFTQYLNELFIEFALNNDYSLTYSEILSDLEIITELGLDGLQKNLSKLQEINDKAKTLGKDTALNSADINYYIDQLAEMASLDVEENKLKLIAEQNIQIPVDIILTRLQSSAYNSQYNKLSLTYGLAMINSMIRSYIQGVNNGLGFVYTEDFGSIEAVEQIRLNLLQAFLTLNISESDIKKIQKQDLQIFESLNTGLIGLEEYKNKRIEAIKEFINLNELAKRILESGSQAEKLSLYSYIQTIFGLEDFLISTRHSGGGGQHAGIAEYVYNIKDQAIEASKEAKLLIESYFKNNPINYEGFGPLGVLSATVRDKLAINEFLNSSDIPIEVLNNWELFLQYLDLIPDKAGRMELAIQQAIERVKNAPVLLLNLGTLSSLETLSAGDTLDELQFAQLGVLLDNLVEKLLIAKDTADILKTEWMQGTDLYKQSLREVSDILLNEFQQALQADPSSLLEVSNSLKDLITNTLTLDEAYSRGLITQKDAYDVLGRLGSQYLSCQDELNAFSAAVASGDELAIKYTGALLLMAIAAELAGQALALISIDPDINEDEWKDLTLYLSLYGELLEGVSLHVEEHKEAAELLAEAMLRYDHALELVADHYDDWLAALTSGSIQDAAQAANELQNVYSDLLDLPYLSLSPDFTQSVENLHLLQEAANGSELAYAELQERAGQDILAQVGLDTSQFYIDRDNIYNTLYDLTGQQWDDILIGAALDDADFLAALEEMVNAAGMTALQATDYLASMGVDALVIENNEPTEETKETSGWTTSLQPIEATGTIPTAAFLGIPIQVPIHYRAYQAVYTPDTERTTAISDNKAVSLKVTSAHKSSGGGFKHTNASHGGGSKGGGRKGGGGGGGGGKKPTPAAQAKISTAKIDTKPKTSNYNPYLQEEKSFDRQSKILDDLQDKLKKLVNKDRLKNLQEQNKTLEKQKDILQKELAISANAAAENSTANYANRLKQAFKDIGFDSDGQIADINKIQAENAKVYNLAAQAAANAFEKEKQEYNNYILNVWNKYADKELQEAHKGEKDLWDERVKNALKAANDSIKAAEDVYKEREDLIKSYNDAWKEDQERLKEYNELTDLIYDNLIAISKIKVDLSIDTGDFERDWLDFENKFIKKLDKDDFLGSAKASAKELMSYFNSNQVQLTANQIKKIRDEIAIMNAGAVSSIYGTNLAQAKEDLEDYMEQQMKDLLEVQDMVDNIKDNYLDAIDDAKDKMDEQIDQYERVNDLIDHNVKMVELLYGDKAYDSMLKYYNLQKSNNERELESLKKQQDYWQKKMNNLVVGSDAWERFKKNLDDVTDNLNDKLEDMIDNLANQFENRVNGIIARLNNALTGGRGLDFLDEQWDYISNYDDNFLDTFETKTGIEEVERLYQSLIDNLVGSPKSQQKLNKLMNDQLKLLREKDHLTEYDLERAKASLEVEKARLALEEARDRKTKMRLRRDSQGNYTYQYVADELKLGDLQAALADAQANLYNTDKLHYKQNLNTLYDTYKDYIEKMRDLTAEYNATQDEEERKRIQGRIDLLKESTAKLMSGLTEDNKYLLNYLNGSFFDGMGTDTSTLTMEEQMEIMKENIPYMQSLIQDLSDTIVGEGGILPATANMMELINKATADYDLNVKNMLTAAGTSLQTIEEAVNKEGNALDKNIINAQNLITANDELVKSCQAQIEAMEKLLDYMDKYLNKVMNVLTLLSNLRSAYNTGQGLNGSNLTADNIGMETWGLDTTSGMLYTGNPKTDAAAIKQQIDALMAQYEKFLSAMTIATFDTGGYTGTWGDAEGRLAFLHSGELVLNQDDTMNILNAVQIVRSMASAINSIASGEINSLMNGASGLLGGINNTEQLDQNVHIEANFPNVTQHTLIEQAFENLVNMASMRASRYRD